MKNLIVIFTVLCFIVGCGLTTRNSVPDVDMLSDINPATGEYYTPDEISEIRNIGKPDTNKGDSWLVEIVFYGGAFILIVGGVAWLMVTKDLKTASCAWGGAAVCAAFPFLIGLLDELLKPLKWAFIGLIIVSACGVVVFGAYKLKGIIDDLKDPESDNKHKETDKILKQKN